MLICKACGHSLPSDAFYASNKTRCKECVCAAVRANREARVDQYREYDRGRANRADRVAARQAYAATDQGRARHRAASRQYYINHPGRRKANIALNNAVRDGRVIRHLCLHCGDTETEGHHPDYSRPLDVVWLCKPAHDQLHTEHAEYLRQKGEDAPR